MSSICEQKRQHILYSILRVCYYFELNMCIDDKTTSTTQQKQTTKNAMKRNIVEISDFMLQLDLFIKQHNNTITIIICYYLFRVYLLLLLFYIFYPLIHSATI